MKTQEEIGTVPPSTMVIPGIHLGRLMSPSEVASATANRSGPEYEWLRRWTLCGEVGENMFELVREAVLKPMGERLGAFTSPVGCQYAVFAHQVLSWQHRLLLPLYEQKAANFLSDAARQGFGYSLAGEETEAVVWTSAADASALMALRVLCAPVPDGRDEDALAELPLVVAEVKDAGRIAPVGDAGAVKHVSVSVIPPEGLVGRIAARYDLAQ